MDSVLPIIFCTPVPYHIIFRNGLGNTINRPGSNPVFVGLTLYILSTILNLVTFFIELKTSDICTTANTRPNLILQQLAIGIGS